MSEAQTVGEWLRWAHGELASSSASARLDAELLLASATGLSRSSILAFPERRPDKEAFERLRALIGQRQTGVPLAYLTGHKAFYSISLQVCPDVLVPRAETELLVDEGLAHVARRPAPRVLDLGTGSGAIALAIKEECPAAEVLAVDSSRAALAVAEANALRLALDVRFIESNWWDALRERPFDLVLCNPPYVRSTDPHFAGSLRFEPRQALDGGEDGLDAIRAVLDGAAHRLAPDGVLLLEHGYDQRAAVAALASRAGLRVSARREDLGGQPRLAALQRTTASAAG